jgi:hypothetical protein
MSTETKGTKGELWDKSNLTQETALEILRYMKITLREAIQSDRLKFLCHMLLDYRDIHHAITYQEYSAFYTFLHKYKQLAKEITPKKYWLGGIPWWFSLPNQDKQVLKIKAKFVDKLIELVEAE